MAGWSELFCDGMTHETAGNAQLTISPVEQVLLPVVCGPQMFVSGVDTLAYGCPVVALHAPAVTMPHVGESIAKASHSAYTLVGFAVCS